MVTNNPPSATLPFLFLFLLVATPSPSHSFSIFQYQTLFSLAHSLITRVANLRAARGDISGSERARLIAAKLERGRLIAAKLDRGLGLGFLGVTWSMGWDYVSNTTWRDMASMELLGAVSEMNELLSSLNELTRMRSESERIAWAKRSYQNVLRVSNSVFRRLLRVFRQSGPLREVVEVVQRDVVEGGLLWDCLEVGSNDLKGLIQIFKDVAFQFSSTYPHSDL